MSNKIKLLTGAVAAALSMGVAGQAAATVYAGSSLRIDNLTVVIGQYSATNPGGGVAIPNGSGYIVPGGAPVGLFNFNLTNTATLGANSTITSATCGGSVASNTCTPSPNPPLDATAANAPGSTLLRTNNATGIDGSLLWYGMNGGDWSNSDSIIKTAQLVDGVPTSTDQIAESNITNFTNASANAEIKSSTGFTFQFTLADPGEMFLFFQADPDLIAAISGELFGALAQANINVSMTLSQNSGGSSYATWAPRGTAANECLAIGVTCTEMFDSENLNTNVSTSGVPNSQDTHSYGPNIIGLGAYGVYLTGLSAGTWTFALNAVTSTLITRVPEPGMLGLMGLGLAGLGFALRRQRKQA